MTDLADTDLPDEFRIDSAVRNVDGETNDVFLCQGEFAGRAIRAYVKVNKHPELSLANESAILATLQNGPIPVPSVIWHGRGRREALMTEALPGDLIWDFIDPRRRLYDKDKAIRYLSAYGECLASVHSLSITWPPQKRQRLYGFIGEENAQNGRFGPLLSWLQSHRVACPEQVFVHGDFNTASVLIQNDRVSGVIDWEFAGTGWREYDLAWTLRARQCFLNTPAEREAILEGYRRRATYDENALRWCEVINYLHFAYWSLDTEPAYTTWACERAMETAGIT